MSAHAPIAPTQELIARNPATGAELARIAVTSRDALSAAVNNLKRNQHDWSQALWSVRAAPLRTLYRELARDAHAWAAAIALEVGKPHEEALIEVATTLDALRWTLRHARSALRPFRIGAGGQRLLLMNTARVVHAPYGTIGIIATWNYPLLLNVPPLVQALAAGNAVVWKPSELAPWCGAKLQFALQSAGLEPRIVATVFGGPEVGQALLDAGPDKVVFTGGIAAGRAVLARLGGAGVPAVAELSGFDPAIILPSARVERCATAIAWSAFVAAGQTCVATKRVYVVGNPDPWIEALAARARALRVGDPAARDVDLGPLISESARTRLHEHVQRALAAGADLHTGGRALPGPGWFYQPTVLSATSEQPEQALAGAFGPVVLVRAVASIDEAVHAANQSPYGLAASVWGRDRSLLRSIAQRLQAGMVTLNDAVTPAGHAAAPFGGAKASGYGRTRGAFGLHEFVYPKAIHTHAGIAPRPQLYPYGRGLLRLLDAYLRLRHRG